MRKARKVSEGSEVKRRRPPISTEARENQMISYAMDLAEQQLRDGTASSQVITHFLKLGSSKERLEKEIMERQKELVTAKTENLRSANEISSMYAEAVRVMKRYNGDFSDEDIPDNVLVLDI